MTTPHDRNEPTVDPKLLEILVCPVTKGPLEYDAARQELVSRAARLAYPIRDGIPIMLPEEARASRLLKNSLSSFRTPRRRRSGIRQTRRKSVWLDSGFAPEPAKR